MVNRIPALFLLVLIALSCSYCMKKNEDKGGAPAAEANPLLQKWEGAYNGVPPFDKVQITDFQPAFEAAMTENRNEINSIASNTEAPTFANTIEALEKTGTAL
ncbi:MAG: M3 family peptidase, partial [Saprospiraceae bacterium]